MLNKFNRHIHGKAPKWKISFYFRSMKNYSELCYTADRSQLLKRKNSKKTYIKNSYFYEFIAYICNTYLCYSCRTGGKIAGGKSDIFHMKIATDLWQRPDLTLPLPKLPVSTVCSPGLGGSPEKSHQDIIEEKPAPRQNICCTGVLSEIKK